MASPGVVAEDGSRAEIAFTTSMPEDTLPNTEWQDVRGAAQFLPWPSSAGVGTNVMKNWLPLVAVPPAFAMERVPGPSWRRSSCISFSNL